MILIRTDSGVGYPDASDGFSPDEAYPEYRHGEISARPNPVYAMVRTLLADSGLDKQNHGTPEWNPLRGWIAPGAQVFVLCNFVYHRRPQESRHGFDAKCIHGSVLRALTDYILLATGTGGRVLFGNAPLQSCDWQRVLDETGAQAALDFYRRRQQPVAARDLRLFVSEKSFLGRVRSAETRDEDGQAINVDLGTASLLSELDAAQGGATRYRVSEYDPRRTDSFHASGSHQYLIHRDILESDVVFSLSKLKAHEKVGLTCALKGFVGTVAHKDCLAHHRFGSPHLGGDEYPESRSFLHPLSRYHDWVYGRSQGAPLQGLAQILDRTLRRVAMRAGMGVAGAWHGNDTAWRMALDLARIVHHADASGTLHPEPVRTHLSLIDGIVAGVGDGPLAPAPLEAGTLVLSDDVAWGDRLAAALLGWPAERIPLLHRAFDRTAYALPASERPEVSIRVNGRSVAEDEVPALPGSPQRPPRGWRDHLLAPR